MIKKISLFLSLIISCNFLHGAQLMVIPELSDNPEDAAKLSAKLSEAAKVLAKSKKEATYDAAAAKLERKSEREDNEKLEYKKLILRNKNSNSKEANLKFNELKIKIINGTANEDDINYLKLFKLLDKEGYSKLLSEVKIEKAAAKAAADKKAVDKKAVDKKAAADIEARMEAAKEKTNKVKAADEVASNLALIAFDKAKEKEAAYTALANARSDKAKVAAEKAIELALKNHQIAQDKFNQALAERNRLREEEVR